MAQEIGFLPMKAIKILLLLLCFLLINFTPLVVAASGGSMGGSVGGSGGGGGSGGSGGGGDSGSRGGGGGYGYGYPYYSYNYYNFGGGSSNGNNNRTGGGQLSSTDGWTLLGLAGALIIVAAAVATCFCFGCKDTGDSKTGKLDPNRDARSNQTNTVMMLQVGFTGHARFLQKRLRDISNNTSSVGYGLTSMLRETTGALLERSDCCSYGYTRVTQTASVSEWKNTFQALSGAEGAKPDYMSVVNVNDVRIQHPVAIKPDQDLEKSYTVVTIVLAVEGAHRLPEMNDSGSMIKALEYLNSITLCTTNEEVLILWIPQDEKETLSMAELHEKFPLLIQSPIRHDSHILDVD